MVLLSAAFSQWLFDALGYLYPFHLAIWGCWIVWKCRGVQDLRRSYPSHPSAKLLIQRLAHALCMLSARLSLELSECKIVPSLWGDSWVNQVVQDALEALEPKWITGNCLRPFGLVWSGDDTLCGGCGDPLPQWRSSLVDATSRWPRELGECLSGEPLWRVK
jgi:hypothetical protein